MNILVFSWRDPRHPLAGGAEQVMHEHMKGWVSAGHKVTFFSSFIKGLPEEEVFNGVKIIRRGHQHLGVQAAAFFWYLFRVHDKFDLVVDEFHGVPFFTPFYIRVKKLAVLQEVAGRVWLKNDLHFPLNWVVGVIGYVFEPLVFLFYKKIPFMVGSRSAKDALKKMGIPGRNIRIVHHGVILERPTGQIVKSKTKTILFLGALAKDKGIEDAIKTFSILDKRGNYDFWIIGKGGSGYQEFLEKSSVKLGVKIKFWGYVTQAKKFELLRKAHLLINPSFLEGWGLVNIEANAVGLPVIAYNSLGLVDSVKDGISGVILKKNTPEELAGVSSLVMSDRNFYNKLSRGAISWSRRFSWDIARRESLKLLRSLS